MSLGQPPSAWVGKLRPGGGGAVRGVTAWMVGSPSEEYSFTSPFFSCGGFCFPPVLLEGSRSWASWQLGFQSRPCPVLLSVFGMFLPYSSLLLPLSQRFSLPANYKL